jgi:hypothetical protein
MMREKSTERTGISNYTKEQIGNHIFHNLLSSVQGGVVVFVVHEEGLKCSTVSSELSALTGCAEEQF